MESYRIATYINIQSGFGDGEPFFESFGRAETGTNGKKSLKLSNCGGGHFVLNNETPYHIRYFIDAAFTINRNNYVRSCPKTVVTTFE